MEHVISEETSYKISREKHREFDADVQTARV